MELPLVLDVKIDNQVFRTYAIRIALPVLRREQLVAGKSENVLDNS